MYNMNKKKKKHNLIAYFLRQYNTVKSIGLQIKSLKSVDYIKYNNTLMLTTEINFVSVVSIS